MNCHEAKNHLFANEADALDSTQRSALGAHLARCAECRRVHDDLGAALTAWRGENARATLPDVEREWYAVRRQIRGGVAAGGKPSSIRSRRIFGWLAVPIGAAAALALALYIGPRGTSPDGRASTSPATKQIARADSVEVPGNASTLVYVDDKSGWLIVWATDARQI